MKNLFSALILLLVSTANLRAQTQYYQGKTITFIVGSGAGTAYDMYARLLANHIGKHILGHHGVVSQNMTAEGSMEDANVINGVAKLDGLTVVWTYLAHY